MWHKQEQLWQTVFNILNEYEVTTAICVHSSSDVIDREIQKNIIYKIYSIQDYPYYVFLRG